MLHMQNAAELKAQLDVHGRRVEELKNELAASRAQVCVITKV